ncbi:MAG: Clp protease N-terminal domain-containing protein [Anaerolineae bacterium]
MQNPAGRFTGEARRALARAYSEAQRFSFGYILPDHLLLGMIGSVDSTALVLLQALAVDTTLVQQKVERALGQGNGVGMERPALSTAATQVIELAVSEARGAGAQQVGTEHLLLGLLSQTNGMSPRYLAEMGVDAGRVRQQLLSLPPRPPLEEPPSPEPRVPFAAPAAVTTDWTQVPIKISPVFIGVLIATLLAADLSYMDQLFPSPARLALLVFVLGGWVLSLSLHEFGHALVAYLGGDHSVSQKGYLSLNPLKYTNIVLSIVLPLFILLMGGIGLPGGAVYVNQAAIRSRGMRSLTSAAGPLASTACAVILLSPFFLGLDPVDRTAHELFWGGLTLLVFLQITAVLFNLLPFPGLDGFGILAPFLPDRLRGGIQRYGFLSLLFVFLLFANDTPISRGFWQQVLSLSLHVGLNPYLILSGLQLLQFWAQH